jgi:hypothetical protein
VTRFIAYFGRLTMIVLGFAAAMFAAGFLISVLLVASAGTNGVDGTVENVALVTSTIVLSSIAGYYALVPSIAAIAWAEWSGKRDWLYYALAGGAIAMLVQAWRAQRGAPVFDTGIIAASAAAGMAGGIVYWLVAGRSAGLWLEALAGPEDESGL